MVDAEIVRAADVYGVARELPLNYVQRDEVDGLLVESLTRDQHVVIFGGSKQGKTSLRKYHLNEDEYIVVTCSNKWTLSDLHGAILKQAGFVLEQSTTVGQSGKFKVNAKTGLAARLFGSGVEAEVSAEKERESSTSVETVHLTLDLEDVNEIIAALASIKFAKWIVLEDFHYLDDDTQRDFAIALKAFHEASRITFIVVGVWLQEDRLVQFNGDLGGRVFTVNADKWSKEQQLEVIARGEHLLNISFEDDFKNRLVESGFDSIFVVQDVCLEACNEAGVTIRKEQRQLVNPSTSVDALVKQSVRKQSARYNDFVTTLASGFGSSSLEVHKWLLVPILLTPTSELERGLSYRYIREQVDNVHPQSPVNAGNVTSALNLLARLQVQKNLKPIVVDYDQNLRKLNVVDRSFIIWHRHLDKDDVQDLLDAAGLDRALVSRRSFP